MLRHARHSLRDPGFERFHLSIQVRPPSLAEVRLFGLPPRRDFAPVGMVAGLPVVIVGKKDLPPNDLKKFSAYVKANAETLNMAHAGVGSITRAHDASLVLSCTVG